MYNSEIQNVFFTSDLHYGSKNIISYCNRPFSVVEEMNEALITNYNSKVTKSSDIVYLLGDLIWGHGNYENVLNKLNGQKHLILGNHDNEQCYRKCLKNGLLQSISHVKTINVDNQHIFMSHYPHRSWNMQFYGSYMLHGHSHFTLPEYGKSMDVGVDNPLCNYGPISFTEVKNYFGDRENLYNIEARDDYSIYRTNFEKYFTEKYKERINKEANYLESVL